MSKNFYLTLIVGTLFFGISNANAQDSIVKPKLPEIEHKLFGNIFSAYYTKLNGDIKPKNAFEMPTALLGYSATFDKKLKATLISDVSRTTNNISVTDTSGNPLSVNYNEGSKYTLFLKMAEIKYSPTDFLDLRMGLILNTQYLTTQDKFWDYRYVYFTFQEVHRYGVPADFGAQVDLKYSDKILNQISITNGEGPFRYQDDNGKFVYANNFEVYPVKGLIMKLYADYSPASDTSSVAEDRMALSAFVGFKTDKYRVGAEYNKVFNYGYRQNSDYYGFSGFGSYTINPKFDIFLRYDYINRSAVLNVEKGHLFIVGAQYQIIKNFTCSLNARSLSSGEKVMLYFNVGVKF